MVLDCPVILHEVHYGVPRTGEAYYKDGLDDGLCGHDNASAFTTLMFNSHDVQQQPHPVVYMAMIVHGLSEEIGCVFEFIPPKRAGRFWYIIGRMKQYKTYLKWLSLERSVQS